MTPCFDGPVYINYYLNYLQAVHTGYIKYKLILHLDPKSERF